MADSVRLRSTVDPSVVIEVPVGEPFNPGKWKPVAEASSSSAPTSILEQNIKSAGSQTTAFHELGGLLKAGAPMIAPGVLGAAGGAVAGPPGMVIGSMTGEGINQAVGLTDPSAANIVAAGTLPGVGHVAGMGINAAAQAGAKWLPGAAASLHEIARTNLDALRGTFAPAGNVDDLYNLVRQFNLRLQMPRMQGAFKTILDEEAVARAGLERPGVARTAKDMVDWSAKNAQQGLPFQEVFQNLKRIGEKVRETRQSGGAEHGAWKLAWRETMADLEAAAAAGNQAQPAVEALKVANAAARREFVYDELTDIMSVVKGGITNRADGLVQVNFGRILNAITKSDDIAATLKPDELATLVANVREMAKATPAMAAPAGMDAGSRRVLGSAVAAAGLVGGPAAYLFGPGAGVAAGMTAAGTARAAAGILSRYLTSDSGRAFLKRVIVEGGGVIHPETLALMGAAASGAPGVHGAVGGGTAQMGQFFRDQMMTGGR